MPFNRQLPPLSNQEIAALAAKHNTCESNCLIARIIAEIYRARIGEAYIEKNTVKTIIKVKV